MANESTGLVGRKLGMTQIYDNEGLVLPVTVVEVPDNVVLAVKSNDGADGYSALQVGIDPQKSSRLTKAELGNFSKAGVEPKRHVQELRVPEAFASKYEAGKVVAIGDVFKEGSTVDVTGTSKGRGFAGVMKKYNFAGFIRSHGTHEFFRHGGSIGTRLTPGHVMKGKKMPGHMGAAQVTVQNQDLVKVDADRNLLYVRGGIPGPNGGYVLVRNAVKA